MTAWLAEYCHSQNGLFVIPIEALTPAGISPSYCRELQRLKDPESDWISRFNRAFSLYWTRAGALHSKSPQYWLPPRLQHVAIITCPDQVRPYFQPFHRNSWLLYAHDFEPGFSTPEFSVFQFFQAERYGLLGSIVPALHANLPYFLTLTSKQRRAFSDGCRATDRPDADAWKKLGESQTWLKSLFHETLRPPKLAVPGMRIHRENGLIVPPGQAAQLAKLQETWGRVASGVFSAYRERFSKDAGAESRKLVDWLSEAQPQALITGEEGRILWDPDNPLEHGQLKHAVAGLTADGNERIRLDLAVIDQHSRRFLSALIEPDALVRPAPYMTEGGLCYVHGERRLIAYDVGAGRNENRLWEPSPPFERLMLGARAVHEWGHLAAESGWVSVPPDRLPERQALTEKLAALFDAVIDSAPAAVRRLTAEQGDSLQSRHGSFGQGLLEAMLKRIEDYMANRVAQMFLSADEMDTYVRNNVASRVHRYRPDQVYMQLIRLVYEYQYLALSRIENPRRWFFESTWIQPLFIDRGVVTRTQFDEIVATVAAICACYEVDDTRIKAPPPTEPVANK